MTTYQKARIFNPDKPKDVYYVQFNPNTLEYSASAGGRTQKGVRKKGARQVPEIQRSPLAGEREARLSVKLFFHSYVSDSNFSDVRPEINRIRAFLPVTTGGQNDASKLKAASPKITFAWGTLTHTGTLESFQATYQLFAFDGTPVQAEVSITIRGEDPDVSASANDGAAGAGAASPQPGGGDGTFTLTDVSDYTDLSLLSWLFE